LFQYENRSNRNLQYFGSRRSEKGDRDIDTGAEERALTGMEPDPMKPTNPTNEPRRFAFLSKGLTRFVLCIALAHIFNGSARAHVPAPFDQFNLPDAWEASFWSNPEIKPLIALEPKKLVDLVPKQAGFRFCRCPNCDAGELDDAWTWAPSKPEVIKCSRCQSTFPNDSIPAKVSGAVPEDAIEVLPHVWHHYPYHVVEPEKQLCPDERIYLSAKRDDAARTFLSKAALYAATRFHEQPVESKDASLARFVASILIGFAKAYPAYAMHFDQPGKPKLVERADLPGPYRPHYQTAKWEHLGSLEVPLNLVIAYALVRDESAFDEAARALGVDDARRLIERDLFLASANLQRRQPESLDEQDLYAYRGLLAVARLLGNRSLLNETEVKIERFTHRGFYHDGLWYRTDAASQARVLNLIDGWIGRLLLAEARDPTEGAAPMLHLVRSASSSLLSDSKFAEIQRAAWPAATIPSPPPRPMLLGGSGLARMTVGQGDDSLDVELRGFGGIASTRLALRVKVGGNPVLTDLDDDPPRQDGWNLTTASHNAVTIDGLNQRESITRYHAPAAGSDIVFHAADHDFQVASFDDKHAYEQSAERYRHTVIVSSGAKTRYAVSVFEVKGGLEHDQIFHGPVNENNDTWKSLVSTRRVAESLAPPQVRFLPTSIADDGRWFVQAMGWFSRIERGELDRPATFRLERKHGPGVVLHLLESVPMSVYTAVSPGTVDPSSKPAADSTRPGLILRRRSPDGSSLRTIFTTLIEPKASGIEPLRRVGSVPSGPDVVVLWIDSIDGPEYLVVNLTPGKPVSARLMNELDCSTDGVAIRIGPHVMKLAGGTFAQMGSMRMEQIAPSGLIVSSTREPTESEHGWFESDHWLEQPDRYKGRTLLITHGDGTTKGWTITRVDNRPEGSARLYVHEEPGFLIDAKTKEAVYYQLPRTRLPGPHRYQIALIGAASIADDIKPVQAQSGLRRRFRR
jgi:hypothetical protein